MLKDTPYLKCPPRRDLLQKLVQQMPEVDMDSMEIITRIKSIGREITGLISKDLESFDLTEGKFYVLMYLHCEELLEHDPPSPSDIADGLGVTRGTITGLLDGLEREGYLKRIHDNLDRRALTISMTDKAQNFIKSFIPRSSLALTKALPLTAAEKCCLIQQLSAIESAVSAVRTSSEES